MTGVEEVERADDEVVAPGADGGPPAAPRRGAGVGLLLLLTAVVAAARVVLVLRVDALTSLPDEIGFLGNAWLIGRGEPAPPMGFAPFYPGTYSLLVAPVAAATDDTATIATAARLVNVALLALLAPLLWALLGRLGRLRPGARAVSAVAATALPGLWVAATRAWPDALLAVLWVLALLALWALASPGPLWRRIWFGPAVAAAAAVHDRFLPVLVLALAVLLLRLALPTRLERWWEQTRTADVLNLIGLVAVTAAGIVLDARVETRWDVVADGALDRLADAPGATLREVPASLLGQGWYALVATFGLAGIGAATLASVAWRARHRRRALWTEPLPLVSVVAVLGALAVQLGAAVQLRAGEAFFGTAALDLLANGRYQEVVLVPLVAAGCARLTRRAQGPLLLEGALAAVAVVLAAVVGTRLVRLPPIVDEATAAGTTWLLDLWPDRPLVAPTVLMVVVLAAIVLLRPSPSAAGPGSTGRGALRTGLRAAAIPVLALAAFTVPGVDRVEHVVAGSEERLAAEPDLEELREALDGRPVAYALDQATLRWVAELGWALAPEGVVPYAPGEEEPPEGLVIAPGRDAWDLTIVATVDGLEGAESLLELPLEDSRGDALHLWRIGD